jgi:hypothetical protein
MEEQNSAYCIQYIDVLSAIKFDGNQYSAFYDLINPSSITIIISIVNIRIINITLIPIRSSSNLANIANEA